METPLPYTSRYLGNPRIHYATSTVRLRVTVRSVIGLTVLCAGWSVSPIDILYRLHPEMTLTAVSPEWLFLALATGLQAV